jgi:tetratricopeptide (TPR) repeat protein
MRRQWNIKFLVRLLAALLVLGVGLYLFYGYQVRRHAAALLARADRAEEQGQADRTVKYLERYLALEPNDHTILARLGLLLARQADSPGTRKRALVVLSDALRHSPGHADLRRCRVTMAMALGSFASAREDLNVLLEAAPHDGELEDLRGQCLQAAGDAASAAACFTKAIELAPGQIDTYARLAGLLRGQLAEPERADQVMENLLVANPAAPEAYLARARYRQEFQSLEEAVKDVRRARELAPERVEVLLASGNLSLALGKFDEARGFVRRGLELYPAHAPLYVALAAVEVHAGRHKEAVACLRDGAQTVPAAARNGLLLRLLGLLIDSGEVRPAAEVLDGLRKEASSPVLDFYDARLLILQGQWAKAAAILEGVRPALVRSPELGVGVHLLLGTCYEKVGDPEQQLAAYTNAVALDGRSIPARLQLGSALLARGNGAAAVNEFRQLLTLPGAPAAALALLARGAILRNLGLPASDRDWGEVTQALDRLAKANPADVDVPILRAEASLAQGQPDRALEVLTKARDQHPDQVALWVALVDLAERLGKAETAATLLADARHKLGERVELRLVALRTVLRRRGGAARPELARLEKGLEKDTAADQERLLGALADAHLQIGEVDAARRLWGQLAERQPTNLGVRLLLFDLALQTDKPEETRRLLDEIKRIEGEAGTWWRYGEAARLIAQASKGDKEGLQQARAYLAEVVKRRRNWSRVQIAEAEIQELLGHPDAALERYQEAVELGDRQPFVIQRLVRLMFERQRFQEADQVIRKLQEEESLPQGLSQLAARIALQTQDADRAVVLARQACTEQPRDHRNHLWLGLSLRAVGKPVEAEASLRRALELADRVPETWVALVQFLAGSGQKDKAEAATEKAEETLPAAEAPLALAQCYEALDRRDRAEQYYLAALASRPADAVVLRAAVSFYLRFGPALKAEPLLRRLIDPATQAPARDVAWARRNLAVETASRGDYRQFRKALALIESNRPESQSETLADRHARAMVLLTRPCHQSEAISELEELSAHRPLAPENQFILAQLYEARGNWELADRRMETLLASSGEDRGFLAHYIRGKLRRKEAAAAQRWLDKLAQLAPDAWETVELQARMLQARGKGAEAIPLLLKFLEPSAGKPSPAETTPQVVGLLEELGQSAAAEKLFRESGAWSERPEARLLYIRFLGRQKRLREALDLCERAWQNCPAEAVASMSVALLRMEPPKPEDVGRVERRLEAACQQRPGNTALLLSLADLRDLQGRYADVEALLRQVLDKAPDHVRALNNLAWLRALRGGKPDEGLALINHALDISGPEAWLLDTRAVVHLATGRADLAREDLNRGIEERPEPLFYFHSALAHFRTGDKIGALEELRKAEAGGFHPGTLHPLERPAYQELLAGLERP